MSIRPIQWDLENPRVHVWNVNLQREIWGGHGGDRRLRRLARAALAAQQRRQHSRSRPGRRRRPAVHPCRTRRGINTAFSTIELKSSDGESWYNALIFEVRRRWVDGFSAQSSYTLSKSEDTTQASTFFSDATNGTTSAFPEFIPDYNKGLSDFDVRHNWVLNFTWELPFGRDAAGAAAALLDGWQRLRNLDVRSGNPLTVFVQTNRSRSQWNPSLGPGIGQDRPSYATGFGADNAVLGPAGTVVQSGRIRAAARGDVWQHRPRRLRRAEPAHARSVAREGVPVVAARRRRPRGATARSVQRAQPRQLRAAGASGLRRERRGQPPISTFGRISTTVTSSRQVQLGVRIAF